MLLLAFVLLLYGPTYTQPVQTRPIHYHRYYIFSADRSHYRSMYVNYYGHSYYGPIKRINY